MPCSETMITYMPTEMPFLSSRSSELNFFKKISARRALTFGPSDPKLNLKMADHILGLDQDNFKKKWNFDSKLTTPTKGRYIWAPVKQNLKQDSTITVHRPIQVGSQQPETCSRVPRLEDHVFKVISNENTTNSSRRSCSPCNSDEQVVPIASSTPISEVTENTSSLLHISNKPTGKCRQTKITDFGRQRKRLLSTSKYEDEMIASPSKKRQIDASSASAASETRATE